MGFLIGLIIGLIIGYFIGGKAVYRLIIIILIEDYPDVVESLNKRFKNNY